MPENKMYRIIFRDDMRYNFGFEFKYADHLKLDLGKQLDADEDNDHWPTDNINRLRFIQITLSFHPVYNLRIKYMPPGYGFLKYRIF